jgi:single-strand DNA-binding protein
MASLNKIMLIGNAGKDPEMRYTADGTPVTSFSLAVNRRVSGRDGQERQEETQWFTISCWRRLAEIANQYVTKGKQVYIEGRVSVRTFEGQDGKTRASLDVTATDLVLLGSGGGSTGRLPEEAGFAGSTGEMSPDDLPF